MLLSEIIYMYEQLQGVSFIFDENTCILIYDNKKYKLIYEYVLTQDIYYQLINNNEDFDIIVNFYGWNGSPCTAKLNSKHKYLKRNQYYAKIYNDWKKNCLNYPI